MAGNVGLWNELNKQAETKRIEKEEKKAETTPKVEDLKGITKAKEEARLQRQQRAIDDTWDLAFVCAIGGRFRGKVTKADQLKAVRVAMFVQSKIFGGDEKIFGGDEMAAGVEEITMDDAEFQKWCVDVAKDSFDVTVDGCWNEVDPGDLRAIARWLEVSPVAYWRPTRTLLDTCTDEELTEFMRELEKLPATRDINLDTLVETGVWTPGLVPDQFVMEKPQTKSKKKS